MLEMFLIILENLSSSTLFGWCFFLYFLIYSDFAGYSLIAIGIAKLIGLNIPANFNIRFFQIVLQIFGENGISHYQNFERLFIHSSWWK